MTDVSTFALLVSGATLLVTLVSLVWNNSRGLSAELTSLRKDVLQALEDHKQHTGEAIRSARELYHQQEKAALLRHNEVSDRISSIEKWARDEFVRKATFDRLINEVRGTVESSAQRVEVGLDQLRAAFLNRAGADG